MTHIPPVTLELKDNEYITSISGSGGDFVKNLIISTNQYRKIKQGKKIDSKNKSPKKAFQQQAPMTLGMTLASLLKPRLANAGNFSIRIP